MRELQFAVLDFETTGLSPKAGRVIELGLVHMDGTGEIQGSWETLLNPGRDLGAQRIHGIQAADVLEAPTFDEIAGRLLELLDGRILVAHNAWFDIRFLHAELERVGIDPIVEREAMLCTMRLSRLFLEGAGRTLSDCCAAYDIELERAHRAVNDAMATAKLLAAYLDQQPRRVWWRDQAPGIIRSGRSSASPQDVPWVARRNTANPSPHFLERIAVQLPGQARPEVEEEYLALLDRSLLDRWLSEHEKSALVAFAEELGLDQTACAALHLQYFEGVARVAWEDGVLTQAEREDLQKVAALLAIPAGTLLEAIERPRPEWMERPAAPLLPGAFLLEPGDRIVLTGEMRRERQEWNEILAARGYEPWPGVTKRVRLVAAADPDSLSGKARKARDYGIPIVSEDGLEAMLGL